MTLVVLSTTVVDAWEKSKPWEKTWIAIEGKKHQFELEDLVIAIKNANNQGEYTDAQKLEAALVSTYKPTGEITNRFNKHEIKNTAECTFVTLMLLIFPACINYIRHGRFTLWNKTKTA